MTPPGRPPGKAKKPRRTHIVYVSLSPDENALIESARGEQLKSVYIRRAALRAAEEK